MSLLTDANAKKITGAGTGVSPARPPAERLPDLMAHHAPAYL